MATASTPKKNSSSNNKPQTSTAGVIVLQWLTYAFWGWLIVGLIWVIAIILINAILGTPVGEIVPYAIAASIVMLPLAFVCDLFYRKHEPLKKGGGAMVIMVIHAVIFAVLGITSLIIAVFTGLNTLINISGDIKANIVTLLTALSAAILYAAAFLRTLNPFQTKRIAVLYSFGMLSLTILLLILAIVGPVVKSVATRTDRLIEQNLSSIETAISNYVTQNSMLPESLGQLTVRSDGAKQLIEDGLVDYTAVGEKSVTTNSVVQTSYRYQLCVDYVAPSANYDTIVEPMIAPADEYSTYVSTSNHGSGTECYKLQVVDSQIK